MSTSDKEFANEVVRDVLELEGPEGESSQTWSSWFWDLTPVKAVHGFVTDHPRITKAATLTAVGAAAVYTVCTVDTAGLQQLADSTGLSSLSLEVIATSALFAIATSREAVGWLYDRWQKPRQATVTDKEEEDLSKKNRRKWFREIGRDFRRGINVMLFAILPIVTIQELVANIQTTGFVYVYQIANTILIDAAYVGGIGTFAIVLCGELGRRIPITNTAQMIALVSGAVAGLLTVGQTSVDPNNAANLAATVTNGEILSAVLWTMGVGLTLVISGEILAHRFIGKQSWRQIFRVAGINSQQTSQTNPLTAPLLSSGTSSTGSHYGSSRRRQGRNLQSTYTTIQQVWPPVKVIGELGLGAMMVLLSRLSEQIAGFAAANIEASPYLTPEEFNTFVLTTMEEYGLVTTMIVIAALLALYPSLRQTPQTEPEVESAADAAQPALSIT